MLHYRVFCGNCMWRGNRILPNVSRPCPRCSYSYVVRLDDTYSVEQMKLQRDLRRKGLEVPGLTDVVMEGK